MKRWSEEDLARVKANLKQTSDTLSATKAPRAKQQHHEDREQMALFEWMTKYARWRGRPLSDFYAHVPNQQGTRSPAEGARLKAMGVRAGYPDIVGDIAAGGHHGHRIELKRVGGEKPTKSQQLEHDKLRALGYRVDVAFGWEEARHAIERYLAGSGWPLVIGSGVVEVDFSTWNTEGAR